MSEEIKKTACVLQQPGHNAPETEYLDELPKEQFKSRIDYLGKGVFRIGACHCDAWSICDHLYTVHEHREFQSAYEARGHLGMFEVPVFYPATKLFYFESTGKHFWLKGNLGYPGWDAPRFPVERFERNGCSIMLVSEYIAGPINIVCMDSSFSSIARPSF
jgi:hypothetical protein